MSKKHGVKASGWGFSPRNSRKWHYFLEGESFSLCGKIGFYFGPTEQGNDNSPDNCSACKRKLASLKAKGEQP